jgi:hypothetical protein
MHSDVCIELEGMREWPNEYCLLLRDRDSGCGVEESFATPKSRPEAVFCQ